MHVFHRATNADYRGSGFDRGHLAAAANHKWTQKAMDDTFYLSNVAPQVNNVPLSLLEEGQRLDGLNRDQELLLGGSSTFH